MTNELISIKLLQQEETCWRHTGAIVTELNDEESDTLFSATSLVNRNSAAKSVLCCGRELSNAL